MTDDFHFVEFSPREPMSRRRFARTAAWVAGLSVIAAGASMVLGLWDTRWTLSGHETTCAVQLSVLPCHAIARADIADWSGIDLGADVRVLSSTSSTALLHGSKEATLAIPGSDAVTVPFGIMRPSTDRSLRMVDELAVMGAESVSYSSSRSGSYWYSAAQGRLPDGTTLLILRRNL